MKYFITKILNITPFIVSMGGTKNIKSKNKHIAGSLVILYPRAILKYSPWKTLRYFLSEDVQKKLTIWQLWCRCYKDKDSIQLSYSRLVKIRASDQNNKELMLTHLQRPKEHFYFKNI